MKLSVITPVYNRADCIGRCIESVSRNIARHPDVEVEHIIVDDGSSDNTPAIVEDCARRLPHLRFVRSDSNRGPNAARNAAVNVSTGQWCVILDSDDFFVDDATKIIADTIDAAPGYGHYMFAPDDMEGYYRSNPLLNGRSAIVDFEDFLTGRVTGDFVHVIATETMRALPFDERLRIHEGVFFLRFYRKAGRVLFTNTRVTIRERSRGDSVTREMLRTSIPQISRHAIYQELYIKFFEEDMISHGLIAQLRHFRRRLLENYVLMGRYADARGVIDDLGGLVGKKERLLGLIVRMHAGNLYRIMLKWYLIAKYDLLRRPVN